ncbi:MAG: CpaF family protein [Clostridia bacterium]
MDEQRTKTRRQRDLQYTPVEAKSDAVREIQERVLRSHRHLLERARSEERARRQFYRLVGTLMAESGRIGVEEIEREQTRRIAQTLLGFGPITDLLAVDEVSEIMVNGPEKIWVERSGELQLTDLTFQDEARLTDLLERIFGDLGRRIDFAHPWADGRLPDGSRVHAVLPPPAVDGPYLTVRKFNGAMFDLEELVDKGMLDADTGRSLMCSVRRRENLLISGAAGTGKTTLMNALSRGIPRWERIVTIEDSTELQLQHPHWLRLETRPANPDGGGEVTMRDLVRNSLRMRPDRIIIGEVRGKEAFELLVALTTGHSGAMATIHASGPRHALTRMIHLIQMADSGIPYEAVVEQLHDVFDRVIHLVRDSEGKRRIAEIESVKGLAPGRG